VTFSTVTGITAELFDPGHDKIFEPIPPFTVPVDYHAAVLGALSPTMVKEYPARWDETRTFGQLILTTKDGGQMVVRFCHAGKGRLCYQIDGKRHVRGGTYEPLSIGKDGYKSFCDESIALCELLEWLAKPQSDPKRAGKLRRQIDMLKRSRGELPPERDG
jgi:hypothetical protein